MLQCTKCAPIALELRHFYGYYQRVMITNEREDRLTLSRDVPSADFEVEPSYRERLEAAEAGLKLVRRRNQQFPNGPFSDPAWEMAQQLYITELTDQDLTVKALIEGKAETKLTLRWIDALVQSGIALLLKSNGTTSIRLTPDGKARMDAIFEVGRARSKRNRFGSVE